MEKAHLDKGITLLMVDLDANDSITRPTRSKSRLNHLGVEEHGDIILIRLVRYTSNVQAARLACHILIGASGTTESSCLGEVDGYGGHGRVDWRRECAGNGLCAICAGEVEHACSTMYECT